MAQTSGAVQSLSITTSQACVWIGPNLGNAEVLVINIASADDSATVAFKASMMDALGAALVSRQAVTATHGDQDAAITQLVINPV